MCLSYRDVRLIDKQGEERQGPTLSPGVRFREVSLFQRSPLRDRERGGGGGGEREGEGERGRYRDDFISK